MGATITFFPVGDGDMMSRIISSVAGVRRPHRPHEATSSSPAAMPGRSAAMPIDHAALTAHDEPGPTGERGLDAAE